MMKTNTIWVSFAASLLSFWIGYFAAWLGMNELKMKTIAAENGIDAGSVPHANKTNYSFTNVSLLCWVMTSKGNLFTRAIHITQTWGPRCNKTIYVTEGKPIGRRFPGALLTLPIKGGRSNLWLKTRAAFTYIHDHYRDKYDWFIKVDDDTFVIIDNLRYFLAAKDTNEPLYYGFKMRRPQSKPDYASGGAGYVLGKEALSRFASVGYNEKKCPSNHIVAKAAEDLMLAHCLSTVGVEVKDSLDSQGRLRFLTFQVDRFIFGNLGEWLHDYITQNITTGMDCCSPYLVTMHYVKPDEMYLFEYLTQHLRLASTSRDHHYYINGTTVPI